MSYVVPRYMFIQAGVPFPDAHLRIVGSHNNVCLNVLAGDVNAGGIREKAYLKYKDRDLKVIVVSPKMIEHPFVATDNLDAETCALVKEALLNIKGKDKIKRLLTPIKATLTGLVPVEDKDYNLLRVMMSAVREDEKRSAEEGGR
jgi:ABC-type phosphate/phosphonate transport system substrate-binding protein